MAEYKNPIPTVDVILQKGSEVLLIKRKNEPFKDHLALPGGFVNQGEKVETAALREVSEETSLEIEPVDILVVYSDPKRDSRRHILTVVFIGKILKGVPNPKDDSSEIQWIQLDDIQKKDLAFDHKQILSDYIQWRKTGGTFGHLNIEPKYNLLLRFTLFVLPI
jgi:8-oxo-dGTP diphosphatase